ncbi:MAG: FtsQ-type POTRA domain-containing protein, partial [Acidimicrobiales bacterium]
SVDTAALARRVESLPWVLEARAERRWPGAVRIEVAERRALAVVPLDEGRRWALVDLTGRVLAVEMVRPPKLAALGGVGRPGRPGSSLGAAASPALRVVAALPPALADRVADVAVTSTGIELALLSPDGSGSAGIVRLGAPSDLDAKLTALRALLDKVSLTDLLTIDVRVPATPVLTRR